MMALDGQVAASWIHAGDEEKPASEAPLPPSHGGNCEESGCRSQLSLNSK